MKIPYIHAHRQLLLALFALFSMLSSGSVKAADFAVNFGTSIGADFTQTATAFDTDGNFYVTGYFTSAKLTVGSYSFDRIGFIDAAAIKVDSAGTVLWVKTFGGNGSGISGNIAQVFGNSIAVDASGNVYISGTSYYDLTTPTLPKIGNSDAFVFKLDSTGNTTWAKNFGSSNAQTEGISIAIDFASNVFLLGNGFVLKLNDSGNTVWSKNYGGEAAIAGTSFTVDGASNVYIGGYFQGGSLIAAPAAPALVKIGLTDAVVLKLDNMGNTVWARNFGGVNAHARVLGIAVDAASNVYLGGDFRVSSLTTPTLARIGPSDAFAIKLNSAGNTVWARNFGGTSAVFVTCRGLFADATGDVYLVGDYVADKLTTPALTKIGSQDIFALKLDSGGNTVWAKNFGGAGIAGVRSQSISRDAQNNIHIGGYFSSDGLSG